MRRLISMLGLCAVAVALLGAEPAWAFLNNGFETDYVYAIYDPDAWGGTSMLRESDGSEVGTFIESPANWWSLSFAGTRANDARLFMAKPSGQADVEIAEYNAAGQIVNSRLLSQIAGPLGTTMGFGNIRFSKQYPNSLFLGGSSDVSGGLRGTAFQIDLNLTTLQNTYIGPVTAPSSSGGMPWMTNVAINDRTGALYMIGQNLGESTETGKGDLVQMTSTTTYNTLIDGATAGPWPSIWPGEADVTWLKPGSLAFRSSNPTDGTATIGIALQSSSGWLPSPEFYLDTTAHPVDVNGNLAYRGDNLWLELGWEGQQDEISGEVLWGAVRGGVMGYASDDSTRVLTGGWWMDADSPAPEPATMALLGIGALGLMYKRRTAAH